LKDLLSASLQPIHSSIPESVIEELGKLFYLKAYQRGEPVLIQGEYWSKALVIESGLVRMHFLRKDGREFNKNFFTENSLMCPLTPTMQTAPSLFGITCIEASTIWQCNIDSFKERFDPNDWEQIQRTLLMRLLDSKLKREHDLLALDARQRYQNLCVTQPHFAERVPLAHLATYLGVTDVSLSRLRRQLKDSE